MYLKLIAANVAIITLAFASIKSCSSETLAEKSQRLERTLSELDSNFKLKADKLFWSQQELAEKLIKTNSQDAYALKKVSTLATSIEASAYAIKRSSLEVARKLLDKHYSNSGANLQLDTELAELLERRVEMRALIDSSYYSIAHWQLLHMLIKLYTNEGKGSSELRALVREIYLDLERRRAETNDVIEAHGDALEDLSEKRGLDAADVLNLAGQLDLLVDSEMGCDRCTSLELEDGVHSMFGHSVQVRGLIESMVDYKLLRAMDQSSIECRGHVAEFRQADIEKVDTETIESYRKTFMAAR